MPDQDPIDALARRRSGGAATPDEALFNAVTLPRHRLMGQTPPTQAERDDALFEAVERTWPSEKGLPAAVVHVGTPLQPPAPSQPMPSAGTYEDAQAAKLLDTGPAIDPLEPGYKTLPNQVRETTTQPEAAKLERQLQGDPGYAARRKAFEEMQELERWRLAQAAAEAELEVRPEDRQTDLAYQAQKDVAARDPRAEFRSGARDPLIEPKPDTPYKPPEGKLRQFLHPWVRAGKAIIGAPGDVARAWRAGNLKKKIADLEEQYRKEHGIHTPEQLELNGVRRASIEELENGLPMYSDEAFALQKKLYEMWAKGRPEDFGEPVGFWEKAARAGGEFSEFIAELTLLKKTLPGVKAGGRMVAREIAPIPRATGLVKAGEAGIEGLAAAGRQARIAEAAGTTIAAGAQGALHGEDPFQTMIHFAPIAGAGMLKPVQRAMAQSVLFGAPGAMRGDWQDVIISGVMGPIVFSLPDMIRYPFRPRGARAGEEADWRGFSEGSKTERLIYRWHVAEKEAQAQAANPETAPFAVQATMAELRSVGDALTRQYTQAQQGGGNFGPGDVKLLREFVRHYRPDSIQERWEQARTAEAEPQPAPAAEVGPEQVRPTESKPQQPPAARTSFELRGEGPGLSRIVLKEPISRHRAEAAMQARVADWEQFMRKPFAMMDQIEYRGEGETVSEIVIPDELSSGDGIREALDATSETTPPGVTPPETRPAAPAPTFPARSEPAPPPSEEPSPAPSVTPTPEQLREAAPMWLQKKPELLEEWANGKLDDYALVQQLLAKYRTERSDMSSGKPDIEVLEHPDGSRTAIVPELDAQADASNRYHMDALSDIAEGAIDELEYARERAPELEGRPPWTDAPKPKPKPPAPPPARPERPQRVELPSEDTEPTGIATEPPTGPVALSPVPFEEAEIGMIFQNELGYWKLKATRMDEKTARASAAARKAKGGKAVKTRNRGWAVIERYDGPVKGVSKAESELETPVSNFEPPSEAPKPIAHGDDDAFAHKRAQAATKPIETLFKSSYATKTEGWLEKTLGGFYGRSMSELSQKELEDFGEYVVGFMGTGSPGLQRDAEWLDEVLADEIERRGGRSEPTPAKVTTERPKWGRDTRVASQTFGDLDYQFHEGSAQLNVEVEGDKGQLVPTRSYAVRTVNEKTGKLEAVREFTERKPALDYWNQLREQAKAVEAATKPPPKVTPQVEHGVGGKPGDKYVLPGFVTSQYVKPQGGEDVGNTPPGYSVQTLLNSETHEGVRYEYHQQGKEGMVRVVDADSGEVVTIRMYPKVLDAQKAYRDAIEKAADNAKVPEAHRPDKPGQEPEKPADLGPSATKYVLPSFVAQHYHKPSGVTLVASSLPRDDTPGNRWGKRTLVKAFSYKGGERRPDSRGKIPPRKKPVGIEIELHEDWYPDPEGGGRIGQAMIRIIDTDIKDENRQVIGNRGFGNDVEAARADFRTLREYLYEKKGARAPKPEGPIKAAEPVASEKPGQEPKLPAETPEELGVPVTDSAKNATPEQRAHNDEMRSLLADKLVAAGINFRLGIFERTGPDKVAAILTRVTPQQLHAIRDFKLSPAGTRSGVTLAGQENPDNPDKPFTELRMKATPEAIEDLAAWLGKSKKPGMEEGVSDALAGTVMESLAATLKKHGMEPESTQRDGGRVQLGLGFLTVEQRKNLRSWISTKGSTFRLREIAPLNWVLSLPAEPAHALDLESFLNDRAKMAEPPPSDKPEETAADKLAKVKSAIQLSADSVDELRRVDLDRVLTEADEMGVLDMAYEYINLAWQDRPEVDKTLLKQARDRVYAERHGAEKPQETAPEPSKSGKLEVEEKPDAQQGDIETSTPSRPSGGGAAAPAESAGAAVGTPDREGGRAPAPTEGEGGEGTLGEVSPGDVPGSRAGGKAVSGAVPGAGGGGAVGKRPDRSGGAGVRSAKPSGADVPVPPERGGDGGGEPADGGGKAGALTPRVETTPSGPGDYQITPADKLFSLGRMPQARANVAAIRLMKQIMEEGRPATDDERQVLVKYAGWGSYSQAFRPYGDMKEIHDELKSLLTPEEWESAADSTTNAMYTPPEIIEAMYNGLQYLGFQAGAIIEPSMGVGHFFGMMYPWLRKATRRVGVEIDTVSGNIAKLLYPRSDIRVEGLEDAALPDGYFDVAIGNVPFGDEIVVDRRYPDHVKTQIHNYFFARSLDLVRPGGVLAFITSQGTLDARTNEHVRQYFADRADLLGAIRLNEKSLPGTAVIADILFLQRRRPDQKPSATKWVKTVQLAHPLERYVQNEYFASHPDMVFGQYAPGTMYGRGSLKTVVPREGQKPLKELLSEAIEKLPRNVLEVRTSIEEIPEPPSVAPRTLPPGSHYVEGGELYLVGRPGAKGLSATDYWRKYEREKDAAKKPGKTGKISYRSQQQLERDVERRIEKLKQLVELRDLAQELLRAQAAGDEDKWPDVQKRLGEVYDRFVKRHGSINKATNLSATGDDYHTKALVGVLEEQTENRKGWKKAKLFSARLVHPWERKSHAETVGEALANSLNDFATVDLDHMAGLLGQSADKVKEQALDEGLIFEDPSGELVIREEYLSGNVKKKLKDAVAANKIDPRFDRNVQALEQVQPKDLPPSKIKAQLGAPWLPIEAMTGFARMLYGRGVEVVRIPQLGRYKVTASRDAKNSVAARTKWGTNKRSGPELLDDALNLKQPIIWQYSADGETRWPDPVATDAARSKIKEIAAYFEKWIWESGKRAKYLAQLYNDEYNTDAPRKVDGSYLTFPGMSPLWTPRPYQKNQVAANILRRGGLDFEPPGAGKTLGYLATGVEVLRLGHARKPLIAVENSTLNDFLGKAHAIYPSVQFLGVTAEQLNPKNRRATLARAAFAENTITILTHESLKKISMGEEAIRAYFDAQINAMLAAKEAAAQLEGKDSPTVKQLRKSIKSLRKRMQKMLEETAKDVGLTFEEIGFDYLIYDESQKVKNLAYTTTMSNEVKGLGPREGNQITTDTMMKIQHVRKLQNGGGVVFGTGTPVSNSMVELYNIGRYLAPEALARKRIESLDDWVRAFGSTETETEPQDDGTYRDISRLRKLVNIPEFMQMFDAHTFRVTQDEVREQMQDTDDPLPDIAENSEGENTFQIISSPMTAALDSFMNDMRARVKGLKGRGQPEKGEDNRLVAMNDARQAALDLKLQDADYERHPEDKISKIADNVAKFYKEYADDRAAQAVFMNFGKPGGKMQEHSWMNRRKDPSYNSYNALIDELVRRGVARDEIAIRQQHLGPEKSQALFSRVNRGEIRVLIGSLKTMGVGVNIHERLIASHWGDPPWTPDYIEQSLGRMVRSGNMFRTVYPFMYVQKGGADEYMYGLVLAKQQVYSTILRGDYGDIREFEDINVEEVAFAAAMSEAARSPKVKDWVEAQKIRNHLENLNASHLDSQVAMRDRLEVLSNRVESLRSKVIPGYEKDVKAVDNIRAKGEHPVVKIHGSSVVEAEDIGRAVNQAMLKIAPRGKVEWSESVEIGSLEGYQLRGQTVKIVGGLKQGEVILALPYGEYPTSRIDVHAELGNKSLVGIGTRIRNLLKRPAERLEESRRELESGVEQLPIIEASLTPFDREAELIEWREKEKLLEAEVAAMGHESGPYQIGDSWTDFIGDPAEPTIIEYEYVGQAEVEGELWIEAKVKQTGPGGPELGETVRLNRNKLVMEKRRDFEPAVSVTPQPETPALEQARDSDDDPNSMLGHLPAERKGDAMKYMREHGPDKPGFGMGAAFNYPDPRGWWRRLWDDVGERLQTLPPGVAKRLADAIGRGIWGTDNWGIDEEVWRKLQQYHGGVKESALDAEDITAAVEKRLADLERRHGAGARQKANDVLTDVAEGRRSPADLDDLGVRPVYEAYRRLVNELTDEFLRAEHLHKYAEAFGLTNLLEIIERKRKSPGAYLRMVFRKPFEKEWEGKEKGRERPFRPAERDRTYRRLKAIQGGMFKHRRTSDLWSVRNYDGTFTQFTDLDAAWEHADSQLENADLQKQYGEELESKVKVYDPFGEEELFHLEPETDVKIRMARTLIDWRSNVEVLRLYDYLAETVALAEPQEGYVKAPSHPRWGPLADKYVPRALADALTEERKISTGFWAQAFSLYNYIWKTSKVTYNPATWGRNLLGLNFFWIMDGIHPVTDMRWFAEAVNEFRTKGDIYRKLVRENEVNVGYTAEELRPLKEMLGEPTGSATRAFYRWFEKLDRMTRKVGRLYDAPDQISKVASYLKHTKGQGWTHREALEALKGYPNYARRGNVVAWSRDTPWGQVLGAPFVAFTGASIQINLRYAKEKPARLMAMWMLPGLLTMATAILLGLDDEEIALINQDPRRRGKSPLGDADPFNWMDRWFMPLLPWRDESGRVQQLDLRWTFPLANDFRVSSGPGGLGLPFLLSQPITKTGMELLLNRSAWTGKDIAKASESPWEQTRALAMHAFEGLAPLPTIATHGWRKIYESLQPGSDRDPIKTLLKYIAGISVSAPFVTREDAYKLLKEKKSAKEVAAFERMLKRYNEVYRAPWDKKIKARSVTQSVRGDRRRALRELAGD